MKILEQKDWVKKYRCTECHSLLEVDESDIILGDFGVKYAGETDLQFYFVCPVCACHRKVPTEEVSSKIYNELMKEWFKRR